MPDIDTDISDRGRDRVLEIIVKSTALHVAQIITFDRMKSRAAIRDVGRALDMKYPDVDRIAVGARRRLHRRGPSAVTRLEAGQEGGPFGELAAGLRVEDRGLAALFTTRGGHRHNAGAADGRGPIRRIGEEQIVTQYSMEPLETWAS